ncbi:MAG: chromate resistance protein ChrB domain-containing protein [Acidimicrobiia bacterium]
MTKWVTRARPKTDRVACPWLILRFIDPDAEILYVDKSTVLDVAARENAISFDAPGARFDHHDGKCTFEVLIDDYHLTDDPALVRLARIVHAADIDDQIHTDPAGAGLLAIGLGGLDVEADDHRLLERAEFVYDALYAWCRQQTESTPA